jgi:hypothetical protein
MMKTSAKKTGLAGWLFNPFTYIAGWQSLLLGLIAILAAGLIGSFTQSHFDGVLDLHTGSPAPLWLFFFEGLIAWLALGTVLLIFGKIISNTRFRPLDLLGTQAMARWPTIIAAIATWPDAVRKVGLHITDTVRGIPVTTPLTSMDIVAFVAFALITLLVTCWFVALSYRSFSVSCNVKGGKAIGFFVAGILIAEIFSKIAIALMFHKLAGTGN